LSVVKKTYHSLLATHNLFQKAYVFLIMTFEQFQQSLSLSLPPSAMPDHLKALWHDAKGDWQQSHDIIQDINDTNAAWIHAYLHRKEGDIWNADYWYSKAGKKRPTISLQQEWEMITNELIHDSL
jgi:hypothetical protein